MTIGFGQSTWIFGRNHGKADRLCVGRNWPVAQKCRLSGTRLTKGGSIAVLKHGTTL